MQADAEQSELVQISLRSNWGLHIAAFAALLILMGVLFWPNIEAALNVWWVSPTFSHCYLIIPISAYLVWAKRAELRVVQPSFNLPALLLMLPLGLVWYLGHQMAINEAQQFMLMSMVQVLIFAMFGWSVYRIILFPALFLFFLVPTGEYLVPPLQSFTTWFITLFLDLLQIPYFVEGTIIELASGRYQVEEACAGLRFLIATVALGALFAYLTYTKWHKIILFVLACIAVPIIGNGFRALGIVLIARATDNTVAVGFDHLVYGWGFSVVIMLGLFFVGSLFRDEVPAPAAPANLAPASSPATVLVSTVVAALAISIGPVLSMWNASLPFVVNQAAFKSPELENWTVGEASDVWQPQFAGADAKSSFSLIRDLHVAPPVDVFVHYYGRSRDGHTLIESTNRLWNESDWNPARRALVKARLGSSEVQFAEMELAGHYQRRMIWWTYWVNGRFTTSGLKAKLERLRSSFGGQDGSALIALSISINGSTPELARAELQKAAAALTDLPQHLSQAQTQP